MEYCPLKFFHISRSIRKPFTVDNQLISVPCNIDVLPPIELAMHSHPYYSITYISDCHNDIRYVDGYKTERLKNKIYLETPQTLHSSFNQLSGYVSNTTIKFLISDEYLIKKIGSDPLSFDCSPDILLLMNEIMACAKLDSADVNVLSKLTHNLLLKLFSSCSIVPVIDRTQKPENEFADLLKYISAHLNQELSLSDLEKQSHISHAHFSRKFKQVFNMTPMNYVYAMRLRRALDELSCTTAPISIIAEKTGFKNVSALCTAFRRAYGCSPSEYREKFIRERGLFHDNQDPFQTKEDISSQK